MLLYNGSPSKAAVVLTASLSTASSLATSRVLDYSHRESTIAGFGMTLNGDGMNPALSTLTSPTVVTLTPLVLNLAQSSLAAPRTKPQWQLVSSLSVATDVSSVTAALSSVDTLTLSYGEGSVALFKTKVRSVPVHAGWYRRNCR